MKVLFVADIYEKYGAFDSFIQMVYFLNREVGVSPVILTSKKKKVYNWALNNHFECVCVKYSPFVFETRFKEQSFLWYLKKLPKLCVYRLELKLALKKCEKKIDFSSIEIIHSNTNRIDIGACLSQIYKIPHVWHIREFGSSIDYNTYSLKKNNIEFMNLNTNAFIFISNAVRRYWNENGISNSNSYVLWNGIIDERHKRNIIFEHNNIKIVMSGFIRESKGQDQLLRAVCILPEEIKKRISIDFYGDIDKQYYFKLRTIIRNGNIINQVKFKGFVDNVKEYYQNYDIGVTCSKSEGLGRTTIDYMSFGCLVIASDTGANAEIIIPEKNGFLYKYGDINDFKEKLLFAINNIDISKKTASYAYDFAYSKFNVFEYTKNIMYIYQSLKNRR